MRRRKLAASFVVTVAVLPACKKTTETTEAAPMRSRLETRPDGRCFLDEPQSCPKGRTCNPPEPYEVDCPNDGGPTRRPPGKEDWVRVVPRLWAMRGECTYVGESFCAPPGNKLDCTPQPATVKVPCTALSDAGVAPHRVETFVWKDAVGGCHEVAAHDCTGDCPLPEGKTVSCDAPVDPPPPPPSASTPAAPWDLACTRDEDCVAVHAGGGGCCPSPCPAGAVNKRDLDRVREELAAECRKAPRHPCVSAGACRGHAILCMQKKCKVVFEGEPGYRKRPELP